MYTPDAMNAGEAEARGGLAPAAAPPQAETTTLGTNATGGNEVPTMFGMDPPTYTNTMLSVFQDPQAMMHIGEIAMKYQQPQWLDYLKQGYLAQKENAGSAVMRLLAGDKQGALEAFNASGQHKASAINDVGDGTYDIVATGPDGQQYTRRLDPKKAMLQFLSPPQYIAHQDRETALNAKETSLKQQQSQFEDRQRLALDIAAGKKDTADQLNTLRDQRWADRSQYERDIGESRGKLLEAQTALANARTGAVGTAKRNWGQINNAIDRESRQALQTTDELGKTRVNEGQLAQVRARAQALTKADPDRYAEAPAEAVYAATQELRQIDSVVGPQVEQEAAVIKAAEPGLFDSGNRADYYKKKGVKDLAEWKTKRADELRAAAMSSAGLSAVGAPKSDKAVSGTIRGTAPAGIATPKTQAEFDALPPKSKFVNPKDNKVYEKT